MSDKRNPSYGDDFAFPCDACDAEAGVPCACTDEEIVEARRRKMLTLVPREVYAEIDRLRSKHDPETLGIPAHLLGGKPRPGIVTITVHCDRDGCASEVKHVGHEPDQASIDGALRMLGWSVTEGTARRYHRCPGCR